jgi:hypothetical protein
MVDCILLSVLFLGLLLLVLPAELKTISGKISKKYHGQRKVHHRYLNSTLEI